LVVAAVVAAVVIVRARERAAAPPEALPVSSSSLLVLTWAPSLCTVESSASGCRSGRVAKLGSSFVLHGLWPQPRSQQYCDISRRDAASERKKPLPLPADLADRLRAMMSDADVMAPHEWYAHGSCSGVAPAEYFSIATRLADEAISILDPLFDSAVGRRLTARAVREAVEARAGSRAGARVALVCRGAQGSGPMVYEVRLSLPTVAQLRSGGPSLAQALTGGPAVAPGCGQGQVP
jgi:ribonuclease T2